MDYGKIMAEAALVAFQTLLQRNDHGKDEYAVIEQIAAEAWDYARAFMDECPWSELNAGLASSSS